MDGLESLRERIGALAGLADVDPVALSGDKALAWATGLIDVRNVIDALTAPFVSRVDELSEGPERFARWKGFPSAAALLSGRTGITAGDALRLISLGKSMTRTVELAPEVVAVEEVFDLAAGEENEHPRALVQVTPAPVPAPPAPIRVLSPLARAAKAGRLAPEKIRIIEVTVEAMTIDTAAFEADAVAKAAKLSLRQLRVWCLAQFCERDPEGYEARQAKQREERFLAFSPQPDGMVKVSGMLDSETAGFALAWFGPEARAAMAGQRGWADDEKQSIGQINADILAALAKHASGCEHATTRPKTTVVVRMPLDVLERGAGFGTCDSLEGPISYQTLRRMAVDAEFIPVVLGGASLPVDVGRARRSFTDAQRIVIGERDRGCAWCTAPPAWCDTHHIQFWSRNGRSDAKNGLMLCVGCHHRVHDCGWDVEVDPNGQVWFIPPETVDPQRRRQPSSSVRLTS
jgi:5-methylcytosine-specific restriction protein A